MKKILLGFFVSSLFFMSCSDSTSTKGETAGVPDQGKDADTTAFQSQPPGLRFGEITSDSAKKMIRYFYKRPPLTHAFDSLIKMMRFSKSDLMQVVTQGYDSIKFWMAADSAQRAYTVVIQRKRKNGNNNNFIYYDIRSSGTGLFKVDPSLCPDPPNCYELIEQ